MFLSNLMRAKKTADDALCGENLTGANLSIYVEPHLLGKQHSPVASNMAGVICCADHNQLAERASDM